MSGKTSYRGFLYQQEIFYDRLLDNLLNGDFQIGFEVSDDVNIEYKIASLVYKDNLIQVKSGDLSEEDFYKIFENWIIETDLSKYQEYHYELISEKKVRVNVDDEFLGKLKKHILDSSEADIRSIRRQAYEKISNANFEEAELINLLEYIKNTKQITECYTMDCIKEHQFKIFDEKFCLDIYEDLTIPRKERFKYIKQKIVNELVDSIEMGNGYIFTSGLFMKYFVEGCQKYSNTNFDPDYIEFRTSEGSQISIDEVLESNSLEVRQLKLAERTNQQIYEDIIREIFYRKLIDYYKESDINKVLITHEEAKCNYESALDELDLNEWKHTPKNVYTATTNKELKSEIISKSGSSKFLQQGCYIHMTSEEVDAKTRIKWGDLDE